LALELAHKFGGEVISADAMQVTTPNLKTQWSSLNKDKKI
jgi:tRNA A37 N6-isopentenylltransferase MiaA